MKTDWEDEVVERSGRRLWAALPLGRAEETTRALTSKSSGPGALPGQSCGRRHRSAAWQPPVGAGGRLWTLAGGTKENAGSQSTWAPEWTTDSSFPLRVWLGAGAPAGLRGRAPGRLPSGEVIQLALSTLFCKCFQPGGPACAAAAPG